MVVVGGAITKAEDAVGATATVLEAMRTGEAVRTDLFRRVGEEDLREVLDRVSTPNISDGNHRIPCLPGIRPIDRGYKMVGPALTVRTTPGDWAKTVEAIDECPEGGVIVVDAGGVGPAVWGELASNSCQVKGVAGVVIDGATRDVQDIRELEFPVWARHFVPDAGEPKGHGEIGVVVTVGGQRVRTGDWVVLYFHSDNGPEGQRTVVTETFGPVKGHRVVRGRETECATHYREPAISG